MASTDNLGDTLLTYSSVYVASAAIGLVLGLVLGLNLGLGQLCRKVGSIAALYALHAGLCIPLRFLRLTSHLILKRVRAEVVVRLVTGLNLRFGLGLVWNSTVY